MEKSYKKPDVKGPRYRIDRMTINPTDFHKLFVSKFPKYAHIEKDILEKIILNYNENTWNHVVYNRDGAELPEGLGYLFVGSCPRISKLNNLNNKLSAEHGIQVKHQNLESDSFTAKIFYTNYANKYHFKMRELWSFKGCRQFTRSVSAEYILNWKRYIQVDPFTQIRKLYEKQRQKSWAIKNSKKPSEDYNEFDLN